MEDKFELNIRGNRFVGIADLVLRDKTSGAISVIDHKSKSMPSLKKKLFENTRQLYTYAFYVKERFGVYPELLRFNMFRYNTFIDEPFSMERYEETLGWIERTIQAIRAERKWRVSSSGTSAGSSAPSAIIVPLPTKSFMPGKGVSPNDHLHIVDSHTAGYGTGF